MDRTQQTIPPVLKVAGDARLDVRAFAGQPCVLAFLEGGDGGGWFADRSADRVADLAQARAELRGLGAVLLLVARRGLWCFAADNEIEVIAAPGTLVDEEIAGLRGWLGAPADGPGLFVLDVNQDVAFARRLPASGDTLAAVLGALGAAGQTLVAGKGSAFALTRRQFVVSSLIAEFTAMLLDGCATPAVRPSALASTSDEIEMNLLVNGARRTVKADPRLTLLDALRERLGMTGTKKGCDQGQCGACTVLVEGRRVNACLTLAVMAQEVPITTIEGVAPDGALHPLQAAFISEDGFQCGYCTSGQIMSALGLHAERRAPTGAVLEGAAPAADELREQMSGNLCRCGAYPNIVAAISRAWKQI